MVSVCQPSDALSQYLPSYLGFSYLGRGVSLHSCSSKAQLLLLTLDGGYLLTAAPPDLERVIAPLGPPAPPQPLLLGHGVAPPGPRPWPWTWGSSSQLLQCHHRLAFSDAAPPCKEIEENNRMGKTRDLFKKIRDTKKKAMATHSSTLAWKIPWMEEPGRPQSMRSLGVRND